MGVIKGKDQRSKNKLWILILFFLNLIIVLTAGMMLKEFPNKNDGKLRYVILRYDDYSLYKNYNDQSYNEYVGKIYHEEEFFIFTLSNEIKMSIALVPFGKYNGTIKNDEILPFKIELLREGVRRGLFEICLHGYQHKNNLVKWSPSEFGGIPLQTQREWIKIGKQRLEALIGTKIKVFVPPFNGWDQNTLKALTENDLYILSAEAGNFAANSQIIFFPYTTTPKEFQYLIENNYISDDKLIIVNIHPHDLQEGKNLIGFSNLKKLFKEFRDPRRRIQLLFFNEAVAKGIVFTKKELVNLSKRFNEIKFWKNLPLSSYLLKTTSIISNRPYYSGPILKFLKIVMAINLLVIGLLISQVMGEKIRTKITISALVLSSGLVLFFILYRSFKYLIYGQIVAGKRFSAIFLLGGVLVGFTLKWVQFRKKLNY